MRGLPHTHTVNDTDKEAADRHPTCMTRDRDRYTDGQADRLTDRQTDRQADSLAHIPTHTHTHTHHTHN